MGTKTITVKTNEENPEPVELIAKSIIEVADAFQRIENSALRRETIVVLLQDLTGLTRRDINKVLDACGQLKKYYLKDIKK